MAYPGYIIRQSKSSWMAGMGWVSPSLVLVAFCLTSPLDSIDDVRITCLLENKSFMAEQSW